MKQLLHTITLKLFIIFAASAGAVSGATFTVKNTNDSGAGSLRQAILDANINRENDTINFDPAVFSTPQKIVLTSGQLSIEPDKANFVTTSLTIQGPGAYLLTISGNNQSRVISIERDARAIISNVKISEGNGVGGFDYFGYGGGILVKGGYAGENLDHLILSNSIVSENNTVGDSSGGGGIAINQKATIINSTISNNSAPVYGAGITISASSFVTLTNSTVSLNRGAGGTGSAIYNAGSTLNLTNCSIVYNKGIGIISYDSLDYRAILYFRNSIIAKNKNQNNDFFDVLGYSGQIVSQGFNIIGSIANPTAISGNTEGNQINVDPQIDPQLRHNGGITSTHALGTGSPAIDRGDNCVLRTTTDGGCLATNISADQRGVARPQDGDGDGNAVVDIGAYEVLRAEFVNAPGAPDLRASDDTGVSDADNITSRRTLNFEISGVTAGATVELFRSGILVGSKTASGNTISFTDSNLPADGNFIYDARQIIENNASLYGASLSVTIDNTVPKVTINQSPGQSDLTNVQPVRFVVEFDETVVGFDASDVSLDDSTAGVSAANIEVSGSGRSYSVSISNISRDGTVIAKILSGKAKDLVDNGNENSTSADNSVTLDLTPPSVVVSRAANQPTSTANSSVNFTAIFSEPVSGFTSSDVLFSGSTANVSSALVTVNGSGVVYNITVSNVISDGDSLAVNVRPGAATDIVGNLSLASSNSNNSVTIDNVAPRVTVNQASGQIDPTSVLPVNFSVVFSEPVTGFDTNDLFFNGSTIDTTGASVNITGSGSAYNVAIGNIATNGGIIRVSVSSGAAVDLTGNLSLTSTSTDNQVTIDSVAPTVNVSQAIGQNDPATTQPINFTVVFSEPVAGFEASDVLLNGSSADISQAIVRVSGSGRIYNVSVTNITSNGDVRVSLPAAVAYDSAGNQSLASTSADNTVMVNLKQSSFDYDGDGRSDISIYRDGIWWYAASSAGGQHRAIQFGAPTDKLVPADYDGDGKTDAAVFRDGTWHILKSSDNGYSGVQFGFPTDIPQPGDFDGDGRADVAVYRPSDGYWYILNSRDGFRAVKWGAADDKPVAADFDGDGKTDVAVFRSSDGNWYLLKSRDGFAVQQFGESTDKPVVGDYDGDGKADHAVYRPSNGTWYVLGSQIGFKSHQWGLSTDKPVPADYDGDGKTDFAVFRDGTWYQLNSATGFIYISFGYSTDKPVPNSFVQ